MHVPGILFPCTLHCAKSYHAPTYVGAVEVHTAIIRLVPGANAKDGSSLCGENPTHHSNVLHLQRRNVKGFLLACKNSPLITPY
jgi:hypothetical protein